MSIGISFAQAFFRLADRDNAAGWSTLSNLVGDLIDADQSLRGDLAHLFLHFQSPSSVHKLSINSTVIAIQDFQDSLVEASSAATVEIKNPQTIRKFILRETNEIVDGRAYLNFLLFLVGAGLIDENKFFGHYTYHEVGGIKTLISSLHQVMSSDMPTLSAMIEFTEKFEKLRPSTKTIRHDLGGMMELGGQSSGSLWRMIFRKTASEVSAYTSRPSLEKHYVCYRFSSYQGQDRIVKSLLVLQSPGSIREHFAFKVFYKSGSDQIRKSVGAIVNLGNVVSCFGSSRLLMPGDELGGLQSDENQVLGPKAMTLDVAALTSNDIIVPGHLLTVNEHREVISSKMICVRTYHMHSSNVAIGSFAIEQFYDELGKYTEFGRHPATAESQPLRDEIWSLILSQLRRDRDEHVCLSLNQKHMDLRKIY